ncbi:MAG: hypothetical protein KDJ19_03025 [Hyphomicrobiaceae bacterium]|nr:hypothetical protein [Hyphomicrobiaceae bacterium]
MPEVLGIWIAGWLAGGLGGIFIFAEVLHRTAFVSGATLPGVMLGPLVGEPPVRMIEGFNLADASLWAVFGLAGGVVAAIAPLLMRRKVRPVGFGFGSVLVLIWSALIAVLVNISFFALVPIVGALTGALYAVWALAGTDGPSPNHQAKRDWRGIGWISLIWFLASIAASILILIVQNI